MTSPSRALVVDDERAVRSVLTVHLKKAGLDVDAVANAELALEALRQNPYDLVVSDVRMPGMSGLELLERVRKSWPEVPMVVMTGYGSIDDAVSALKAGASDYLIKPVAREEFLAVVERALAQRAMRTRIRQLEDEVDDKFGFEGLIGSSEPMQELYRQVQAVARTSATVLIQGETGTGKELFAHAIHHRSSRRNSPYIRMNCGAIPSTLLESELFGHEEGAFSGAVRTHIGRFEQADGGTLFLDELGEMDLASQVKLLRVLENGEFQRLGSSKTRTADVRILAATNRNLLQEVEAGRFREDLYYRLNVVSLRLPPLRSRTDDIPLLTDHFVRQIARKNELPLPALVPDELDALQRYDWPGNVRELRHHVERSMIMQQGAEVLHLPVPGTASTPAPAASAPTPAPSVPDDLDLPEALRAFEEQRIRAALDAAGGVQAQAARDLGVSRSNLAYRLKKLGITP